MRTESQEMVIWEGECDQYNPYHNSGRSFSKSFIFPSRFFCFRGFRTKLYGTPDYCIFNPVVVTAGGPEKVEIWPSYDTVLALQTIRMTAFILAGYKCPWDCLCEYTNHGCDDSSNRDNMESWKLLDTRSLFHTYVMSCMTKAWTNTSSAYFDIIDLCKMTFDGPNSTFTRFLGLGFW